MPESIEFSDPNVVGFKEVCTIIGICHRTGRRWIIEDRFPKPFLSIKRSHTFRRWRKDEVVQWCQAHKDQINTETNTEVSQ